MTHAITQTQAIAWLTRFYQFIEEKRAVLNELDTPIGDGDHGENMVRGMTAVMAALKEQTTESSYDVFKLAATQLLSHVGGASGPLYWSAFMGIANAQKAGDDLLHSLMAGLTSIQKRGKSQPGEKTMVDVWNDVIQQLQTQSMTKQSIEESVIRTADLKATKGRASYLGERSIGHQDPGAYSSGLFFQAMYDEGIQ